MQIHELKSPKGSRKTKRIVGRGCGSGRGKTSGRGHTGQGQRAGRGILANLEGGQMPLIRRLPKVGFRAHRPSINQAVNLESLTKFKEGSVVDGPALKEKNLISSYHKPFKILGTGEIKKALTIQAYGFSKSAQEKIKKAGGKAEIIDSSAFKRDEKKESTKKVDK